MKGLSLILTDVSQLKTVKGYDPQSHAKRALIDGVNSAAYRTELLGQF